MVSASAISAAVWILSLNGVFGFLASFLYRCIMANLSPKFTLFIIFLYHDKTVLSDKISLSINMSPKSIILPFTILSAYISSAFNPNFSKLIECVISGSLSSENCVNTDNIVQKTKDNFLNQTYLYQLNRILICCLLICFLVLSQNSLLRMPR